MCPLTRLPDLYISAASFSKQISLSGLLSISYCFHLLLRTNIPTNPESAAPASHWCHLVVTQLKKTRKSKMPGIRSHAFFFFYLSFLAYSHLLFKSYCICCQKKNKKPTAVSSTTAQCKTVLCPLQLKHWRTWRVQLSCAAVY